MSLPALSRRALRLPPHTLAALPPRARPIPRTLSYTHPPLPLLHTNSAGSLFPPCTRTYASSPSLPPSSSHFDTHAFVQRLERDGIPRAQAEGIMEALSDVIEESVRNMAADMVSRAEHEKNHYTQKVDFAALKSEIQLHEKNDLTSLKAENERLMAEVDKLKQRLREEITRTQAGVRLDLNLEKGRIRDEASVQELKLKEVDTRMESEVAALRTYMESTKFVILQYIVGIITTGGALLLAYLRMFR